MKKFRLNNKNEIIINDYASVQEVQLNFQKIEKKREFVTIAHINNESELYDIVNITRIIYNLEPVETVDKNEKKIHLRKATLQDKTDDIPPITIFGDLVNQINNESMTVTLMDLRVSIYMTTRLLKSTDTTPFQVSDKEMSIDSKDLRDANSKSIPATNVSVDLTSLNEHLVCLKCKQIVVPLEDDDDDDVGKSIFICNACNSMVDETQCKSVGKVVFLAQTLQTKVTLNAEPALVVTVFGVPITEKFKLARSMIKSNVNIKYSVADFKVSSIEKAE